MNTVFSYPLHMLLSCLLILAGFVLVLAWRYSSWMYHLSSPSILIGFLLIMHKAIVGMSITFGQNIYFKYLLSGLCMYLLELMTEIFNCFLEVFARGLYANTAISSCSHSVCNVAVRWWCIVNFCVFHYWKK
jgi:hypothetical protein